MTAIALCGKGAAPKTSVATVKFPASGSSTMKTATATCPGKTEVVFGGFRGDFDDLSGRNAFIFSFYRSSKKAISVRGGQNYVFGNTQVTQAAGHRLLPLAGERLHVALGNHRVKGVHVALVGRVAAGGVAREPERPSASARRPASPHG